MPYKGYYKVELWGASGGPGLINGGNTQSAGGRGAYTAGTILVNKNVSLYVYIGGQGVMNTWGVKSMVAGGWNGGGDGAWDNVNLDTDGGSGGGATDIRKTSGAWNNADSLRSRIMVASGGGGGGTYSTNGGTGYMAGGLSVTGTIYRYSDSAATFTPTVNQTTGYLFGVGKNGAIGNEAGGGGGGGWYGGYDYDGGTGRSTGGSGGSSYISGHTGSVAVTSTSSSSPKSGCTTGTTNNACSITPYINPATNAGYTFTNTVMIDGAGYKWTNTKGALQAMPNPSGGNYASGVGHSGNGYAKITWLGDTI